MKKINWINIAILFLLVLNASVFSMFLIQQRAIKNEFACRPFHKSPALGHRHDRFGDFVSSQLDFNQKQMDEFMQLRHSFHLKAKEIGNDLNELRKDYFMELVNSKTDTLKLIDLSDKIGDKHKQLKQETYRYYIHMHHLCNDEQNQRLDSIMHVIIKNEMAPFMGPHPRHYERQRKFK